MIRKRIPRKDDLIIHGLIINELIPFTYQGYIPIYHSFKAIRQRLKSNVTFVHVGSNDRLTGFITIQPREQILFIDMLAVAPKMRGQGIGKKLLLTAHRYGRKVGCMESQLFVDISNPLAFGFYRSLGYDIKVYSPEVRCYLMRKPFV